MPYYDSKCMKEVNNLMNISNYAKYSNNNMKNIAKIGAVAAVVALSLGATTGSPSSTSHFVARASTLNPAPLVAQPMAPVVEETVVVRPEEVADLAPEVAPVVQQAVVRAYKASPVYAASSGDIFGRIRQCESGGNYSTNTGNGYYGAYQYDRSTWNGHGGYSTADQAPPEMQDQKARSDYARRGGSPWPVCSRR